MRSTFKILFYLKRNAVRKNGNMPIIARITINGKISQFSTKLEVPPEKWSVKHGEVLGLTKESKQTNSLLIYDCTFGYNMLFLYEKLLNARFKKLTIVRYEKLITVHCKKLVSLYNCGSDSYFK